MVVGWLQVVVSHNMGHGGAVTWPSVGIFHRHPRPAKF